MKKKQITQVLGNELKNIMEKEKIDFEELQEIHIRAGKPVICLYEGKEKILPFQVTKEYLREIIEYISEYSFYAYENEMSKGFITIEGGHRVGIAGKVIVEGNKVKNIQHISSINIRISHEVRNCADEVFPYITKHKQICHTLIISSPGCGKTTLLRDIIRQVSNGNGWVKGSSVGVVDERSELGGCHMGIPQNDLGIRTDILDSCPKEEGLLMLIRSMTPRVVAVDEIGGFEDVQAIEYAIHCGSKMIATIHGESMEEITKKPLFNKMIKEKCFERYIVLKNEKRIGQIAGIYDENKTLLYKESVPGS